MSIHNSSLFSDKRKFSTLAKNKVIKQWETHLPQLRGHVKKFKLGGHFIEEIKPKQIADSIIEIIELFKGINVLFN